MEIISLCSDHYPIVMLPVCFGTPHLQFYVLLTQEPTSPHIFPSWVYRWPCHRVVEVALYKFHFGDVISSTPHIWQRYYIQRDEEE